MLFWQLYDGDSKVFSAVESTYDCCKVEKLDCVGHARKRMGKHLMNFKSSTKGKLDADGEPIGRQGRLTESCVKTFKSTMDWQYVKTLYQKPTQQKERLVLLFTL